MSKKVVIILEKQCDSKHIVTYIKAKNLFQLKNRCRFEFDELIAYSLVIA